MGAADDGSAETCSSSSASAAFRPSCCTSMVIFPLTVSTQTRAIGMPAARTAFSVPVRCDCLSSGLGRGIRGLLELDAGDGLDLGLVEPAEAANTQRHPALGFGGALHDLIRAHVTAQRLGE